MKRRFAITSLIAAGLFPAQSVALAAVRPDDEPEGFSLFDIFQQTRAQVISAHRSHSSHSSHRSHRSSSGGGGYVAPRVYSPPTTTWPPATTSPSRNMDSTSPSSILPSPSATAPKAAPNIAPDAATAQAAEKFKDTVRVVQLALQTYGYYTGAVDGFVGPDTSTAISKMQADYGLKVTGTVTPEVLNALKISGN
jgi:His-Xaa-Ser repeat protein HxsA